MIAYVDSSALTRAYLADESGRSPILEFLDDEQIALVTGTWTRIEVSGALARSGRSQRVDATQLLALLDRDLGADGAITVVRADQADVEERALGLVREHAVRAMDAWHLATAQLVLPVLAEAGEAQAFLSRDTEQAAVATLLGFELL